MLQGKKAVAQWKKIPIGNTVGRGRLATDDCGCVGDGCC